MRKTKLNFSTNAKLEKLIGRELITNNIIAIFELIKNSYDAMSIESHIEFKNFKIEEEKIYDVKNKNTIISDTNSKIIIRDDGKGMSFQEIQENWMEIGTISKENQNELQNDRAINGEKGIGRFGTDRIGSKLKIISIGAEGKEKTILSIDWNVFDDHTKKIEDFEFDCFYEDLKVPQPTGVTLEISSLRDDWTYLDILKLRRQLKRLVSPYSEEKGNFSIFVDYGNSYVEKIKNDSFEYANTWIDVELKEDGEFLYELHTPREIKKEKIDTIKPVFGPVKCKILYMDRAAKAAFSRNNGMTTAEYGNIKVFRDDFRVLPYGERENDWLGIDNVHAQGTFRTFGTRDLIGYVQITKAHNPALKDVSSRQGINEETVEFEGFKNFIWYVIVLLQEAVFKQIKEDSKKQGKIIDTEVDTIRGDIVNLISDMSDIYKNVSISEEDKKTISTRIEKSLNKINHNVTVVKDANKQLEDRVNVMERMMGSESRIYDMLHVVKNRLESLDALVKKMELISVENNIDYDSEFAQKAIVDIRNIVLAAMKRSSPRRNKRDTIILSEFVSEFIEDNKIIYPNITFNFQKNDYTRIRVNVESLRISLENLLSNSAKAMRNEEDKRINIYIKKNERYIDLYFDDSGIGIKKEYEPFIFRISYSKTGGTGIGLSTVLENMKDEKGDIILNEKGTLKGASFRLQFPILGGTR